MSELTSGTTQEAYIAPKELHGVVFEKKVDAKGKTEWRSCSMERKIAMLWSNEKIIPEEGVAYDVRVVADSRPGFQNKGIFTVEFILEDDVPLDLRRTENREAPLALEVDKDHGKVYVLESELPYNPIGGKLVPGRERFRSFSLGASTLETMEKIATAVELREPCLLEGETSTSKTSSIEYVAMQSNQPVVRLNLNGQTDTSELIGKYVPNDGQLQLRFEEVLQNPDLLKPQTVAILEIANGQGRGLTLTESQKIAQIEDIQVAEWHWKNGVIPEAMIQGYWVILDEMNLAEPQILERLNSILEKNAVLILSENGGLKIGEGGDYPVHQNFRIFGTMNPAEYNGRTTMSPAYKDRWSSYKFVSPPGQQEYVQMMELMLYGNQPEVEVNGKKYKGDKGTPELGSLAEVAGFKEFLPKLAKLQVTLESLARSRTIGKGRKEPYIFTRRGLIEFMHYLSDKKITDRQAGKRIDIKLAPKEIILRAIQYYYLDKITNDDDLKKVNDQLDAIGISIRMWQHIFPVEIITPQPKRSAVTLPNPNNGLGAEEDWNRAMKEEASELAAELGVTVGSLMSGGTLSPV